MKDIPTPTLNLAMLPNAVSLPNWGSLRPGSSTPESASERPAALDSEKSKAFEVTWAKHLDQVRAAQRLRYDIFSNEMGARLSSPLPEHDIDRFDDFCEHLIVSEIESGQVIGTYRLLTPAQARRAGGLYTETEFEIAALSQSRGELVELGRSCVHANHRSGAVILALWSALAQFMASNRLHTMIGCASIAMWHQGHINGQAAASIWQQLQKTHLCPDSQWQATAHTPLPIDAQAALLNVEPPALIKGYLRLGAKVLGAPAWDPDFNTADLPMLMRLADLPARYRKHFLG